MARKQLTLTEKIFRITKEATVVQRNGVGENNNLEKPLYTYAKIEDVLAVVNPLLEKYKLILTGNVPKEPMTHVSKMFATTEVLVEWTLRNLEPHIYADGTEVFEAETWRVPGSGTDDQGKGVYKAITGSRKYACVLIFNLKFGDEPEAVGGRPATAEEKKMIREVVDAAGQ